jgi:hypothetical protein
MNSPVINTTVQYTTNTIAVSSTTAAVLGWLPPLLAVIASIFTIVWIGMQIIVEWDAFVIRVKKIFSLTE